MSTSEPWRNPRPAPNLDEVRRHSPQKPLVPDWLRAWWPALLWACLISFASTDLFSTEHTATFFLWLLHPFLSSLSHAQFEFVHTLIRKSAHFSEYFIFYLVLFRGIRNSKPGWRWTWAWSAWLIAAGYSALDEIHQSFISSRHASPWDSLLDSTGALFALLAVYLFFRQRQPKS